MRPVVVAHMPEAVREGPTVHTLAAVDMLGLPPRGAAVVHTLAAVARMRAGEGEEAGRHSVPVGSRYSPGPRGPTHRSRHWPRSPSGQERRRLTEELSFVVTPWE
jgi:hypothetical protein